MFQTNTVQKKRKKITSNFTKISCALNKSTVLNLWKVYLRGEMKVWHN